MLAMHDYSLCLTLNTLVYQYNINVHNEHKKFYQNSSNFSTSNEPNLTNETSNESCLNTL